MHNAKLIIGLTGGIGSGKSSASKRFALHNITVIDADKVAREVVVRGSNALSQITDHFGPNILDAEGNLNRSKLRAIIFNHPDEKIWLESLLHPLINIEIHHQLNTATSPYTILESPLLLETKQFELVDRIIVVDTSEALQLERASARDKSNAEQIKTIMQSQLSRQERCARANDIIQNHGSLDELYQQVDKLHQLYIELAQATLTSN